MSSASLCVMVRAETLLSPITLTLFQPAASRALELVQDEGSMLSGSMPTVIVLMMT